MVSGYVMWCGELTVHDRRRSVDDSSWYSLWLRTVGSLGFTRYIGISRTWLWEELTVGGDRERESVTLAEVPDNKYRRQCWNRFFLSQHPCPANTVGRREERNTSWNPKVPLENLPEQGTHKGARGLVESIDVFGLEWPYWI